MGANLSRQTLLSSHSALRILALGGEQFPTPSRLKTYCQEGNKTVFFNLYGITEVSCWATCHRVADDDFK